MRKIVRNSVVLLLIFAALGAGIWWVLNAEPEKKPEPPEMQQETQAVYTIKEEQIASVEIRQGEDVMLVVREGVGWTIAGMEPEGLSQFKLNGLVSSAAQLKSQQTVSDTPEACGLDAPEVIVVIKRADGGQDVIKIGGRSPLLDAYFFTVNADKTIYTMNAGKVQDFMNPAEYYTEFVRVDFSKMDITDIKIERTGKNTITLHRKPGMYNPAGTLWELTAPYSKIYNADDQYVQEQIVSKINGLTISTPAKTVDAGLDSPRAAVTVTAVDGTQTVLRVGRTAGAVAYVALNETVYEVPAQSVSFVDVEEALLVFKLLALVPVQTLHQMTVECDAGRYSMDVSHTAIGAEQDQLQFQMNRKTAADKKAREAYQQVIGLEAAGTYQGAPLGKRLAEVVFYSQNAEKHVVFQEIDALYASFTVDGITDFVVKKKAVEDMLEKIQAFAENPA